MPEKGIADAGGHSMRRRYRCFRTGSLLYCNNMVLLVLLMPSTSKVSCLGAVGKLF